MTNHNNPIITADNAGTHLDQNTDYAAFCTAFGGTTQVGVVNGFTALRMLFNSTAPETLSFRALD